MECRQNSGLRAYNIERQTFPGQPCGQRGGSFSGAISATARFGAASTALCYRGRYWLTSFRGDRMIAVPPDAIGEVNLISHSFVGDERLGTMARIPVLDARKDGPTYHS